MDAVEVEDARQGQGSLFRVLVGLRRAGVMDGVIGDLRLRDGCDAF